MMFLAKPLFRDRPLNRTGAPTAAWRTGLALAALVGLAIALRGYGTGEFALASDEELSRWYALRTPSVVWRTLADFEWHTPFYYTLLGFWVAAFGDSEAVIRALSVVMGALTIPVVYFLARLFLPWGASIAAASLIAASPLQLWHAQEARMYTLLTFCAALSLLAAARIWLDVHGPDGPTPDQTARLGRPLSAKAAAWVLYVIATAGTLWVHNLAFFLFATVNLLFGVAWLANRAGGPRFAAQWIAAQLAVLALWAPWLLELRQQLKDFGGSFPFETATTADIVLAAGLLYSPLQTDFLGPNLLLAAGAVCAALWALRRRPKTIYLLAGLSFIPFLAQIALIPWSPSTFAMRSLLWTQIPLSVMAAAIVAGRGRLTSLLLSSAILVANAVVYYAYYGPRPGEDWRGVAQHIEQSAKPGELVLFTNSFDPLSFEHYFAGDHSALTIANLRSPYPPTRHELNFRLTEEHLAALPKIVAGHGRVWVLARLWKDYGALLAPALERLGRIEEIKQFRGQYLFVIQVSLAKDAAPTAAP